MSLNTGEEQIQSTVSDALTPVSSRWLGLTVVLIATFMAMLDGFIVNVAVPSIQSSLHANPIEIELIGAAYSLPYALLVITGGRLGDLFGVRRLFLLGMAIFTIFSALCALAPNPILLLAARVGQALGGALLYPQVLSFIQLSFQEQERPRALSMWGAVNGLASIFGQLIGGSLITANVFGLGWRSIFLVNVPLGVIVLLGAWAFVFERRAPRRVRLDLTGTLLVAVGILLFLYPIVMGSNAGWPWWMVLCLPLALLVFVGFGWFERRATIRGATPLINPALFRLPSFVWGGLLALVWCASTAAFFFILALYLQRGIGFSALVAGLTFTPIGVIFIMAAALASKLIIRLGSWTFAVALGLTAAGTFGLLLVANASGKTPPAWGLLLFTLLLIGFGLGLGVPSLMTLSLRDIPTQEAGSASGVMETVIQLGFALGTPLIGLVFFSVIGSSNDMTPVRAQDVVQAFTQSLLVLGICLTILLVLVPLMVRVVGRTMASKSE
ncbi:MFS transporter [Dictyobacter aurantiacus]|uniref:MFS transporter n=1 Tax=Dictyobacter aurantiacus TaxID=1936993 RepID=A0A401ZLH9_9CHLR|nr:MFS transporter [Dictyobacter aurantiacus]GCE07682.1 MFS transporter [Dictyobacter aurantiacus]